MFVNFLIWPPNQNVQQTNWRLIKITPQMNYKKYIEISAFVLTTPAGLITGP